MMTDDSARFRRPTGPAWSEPAEQPTELPTEDAELSALERIVAAGEAVLEAQQQAAEAFTFWLDLLRERERQRHAGEQRPGGTTDDG